MIKTDPSTAGGKDDEEVKNPSSFQHNGIPAMNSQSALLAKSIFKSVMWQNIGECVVNGFFQSGIKSDPLKINESPPSLE